MHRPGSDPTSGPSALSVVPGCTSNVACPDQAHTWHLGVGQDFSGSMVVPVTKQGCGHACMNAGMDVGIVLIIHEFIAACRCCWLVVFTGGLGTT